MTTSSIAVKLEDEIKNRIQHLGEIKDRSSHWLMKRAILDYLEKEEKLEQEKQEDKERWEQYAMTGEAIAHDDMKDWLKSL
jgi:predicted transcriptional regulator